MTCPKCGTPTVPGASFCEHCGQALNQQREPQQNPVPVQKKENMVTGIVGALIGAALGGGSIILLSQLGYVAAISGLILAVCTLKGYELLGGRLSGTGIVICVVLMLATPYFADRLDWAIVVMNSFSDMGVTLGEAYGMIPMLIEEEAIAMADYLKNLLMIYGFVLLGAFSTLRGAIKKN